MADGLSIAASVAGLVSLGFQVCNGITTYLDGLKCRAEELESARKYEQSLKASIQTIDKILSQPNSHHQNSSTDIAECIKPCKDELKALEGLVAELCGEKTNNPSWLDRAKASKKRLTYAFDRPKLSQLQAKVGQAIQSLQLALQILGLETSSSLGHTLQRIETTSNVMAAEFVAARADFTEFAGDVSALRNEAPITRAAIENIGPSLLDLGQLATQSVQGIQVVREDTDRAAKMVITEIQLLRDQVATLQTQSTISGRNTAQLLQLAQQEDRRLFSQMVSRPSYLEEIFEEYFDISPSVRDAWKDDRTPVTVPTMTAIDGWSSNSVTQSGFGRKCNCRARKRLQRKQVVWSGISFFQDDVYSEKHFPRCQFWQGTSPAERKWGLRQAGIGWLAQKAIEITFSCKSGAGGASFSPSFTYYPTVDEEIAPGFRLVQVLEDALHDLFGRSHINICDWQWVLKRGFKQLETLFRDGRTSPNDMNDRNQTLIFPLSRIIWTLLLSVNQVKFKPIILDFVEGIKRFEIPSNIYDTDGESPIKSLTAAFSINTIEAVEILFDEFASIFLDSINFQRQSQMIAEAYGCGQLSQAVLAGDSKQVERILEKDPASMMEVNCWGQTPLHLSISQLAILQLLIPHFTPSHLDQPDYNGLTAFHYALMTGSSSCEERWNYHTLCHQCHCTEAMDLLLRADCAVDIGPLKYTNYRTARRCQTSLIRGLMNRRNRLKQLAFESLSESDIMSLNLGSRRVLDAQTATILGLLEAKGVHIPPSLRLIQQQKTGTPNGSPGLSVYHVLKREDNAELFWVHGFQDFDEFNGQFEEVRGNGLPPIATCEDKHMIMWLFNHGANLFRELNLSAGSADRKSLCVRTAHFVYRQIGDWIGRYKGSAIFSPLHEAVLSADLFDNCECSCSKQGCTPFLMMLKALHSPWKLAERRSNIFIVESFLEYLGLSPPGLMRNQYKEAVRYFTFTALDMSHTCHHKPDHRRNYNFTCSATIEMCENARHIQDEQADIIELLEEILSDLEAKLDGMIEDDEDFDMGTFFTDHWLVRVEKELEAISGNKLSEGFKKETEALGVVWNEATEQTDSGSEAERRKPVQYWLDAIDRAAQL